MTLWSNMTMHDITYCFVLKYCPLGITAPERVDVFALQCCYVSTFTLKILAYYYNFYFGF